MKYVSKLWNVKLKQKINPKQTKPVLSNPDVKNHPEELHWNFVIAIIDKVAINFGFVCTKYYTFKLLEEVPPNKNKNIRKYVSLCAYICIYKSISL